MHNKFPSEHHGQKGIKHPTNQLEDLFFYLRCNAASYHTSEAFDDIALRKSSANVKNEGSDWAFRIGILNLVK